MWTVIGIFGVWLVGITFYLCCILSMNHCTRREYWSVRHSCDQSEREVDSLKRKLKEFTSTKEYNKAQDRLLVLSIEGIYFKKHLERLENKLKELGK